MYKKLNIIPSEKQYRKIVLETIDYFMMNHVLPEKYNRHVLDQLNDIIARISNKELFGDTDAINERYDLGAVALRCFDDNSEAQNRLIDVFWGVLHYTEIADTRQTF